MAYLIIASNIKHQISKVLEIVNQENNTDFTTVEQLINHPEIIVRGFNREEKLGIEDIKELQTKMIYKPMSLKKQTAIIFNCKRMTSEAQNALLKTLEDQSDWCEYILTVDNEHNLLGTIQSRCQKVYPTDKLNSKIQIPNSKLGAEKEVAESDNSEKNTDQKEQEVDKEISIEEFSELNIPSQFEVIEKLIDTEKERPDTIQNFITKYAQFYKTELNSAINSRNPELCNKYIAIIQRIDTAKTRFEANTNKKLTLENMVLQISNLV